MTHKIGDIVEITKVKIPEPKIEFNPGDQVMLKSGGYQMTVAFVVSPEAAYETGREIGIHCDWHDEAGGSQHGVYREGQLRKV